MKGGPPMAFDTLVKEAESMTEDQVMQLLTFARFLKSEAQSRKKTTETSSQKHRRTPGGMPGRLWMADDFDETPDCFAEYM